MRGRRRGKKWLLGIYPVMAFAVLIVLIFAISPALSSFSRRLVSDFFHPYLALSSGVKTTVAEKSLLMQDKETLAAALTREQEALTKAQIQAERATALERENRELRELLKLASLPNYRYLAAEVEQFDPLFWTEHFTLNRGSDDGVKPDLAVITLVNDNGNSLPVIAGFVRSVSKHSCQVVTLYSRNLRLPIYLLKSRATGFLNGENNQLANTPNSLANISYLPNSASYTIGDLAITTNFNPNVPSGLRVGELVQMDSKDTVFGGNMYRSGYIRPSLPVRYDSRFMMIIIPESSMEE